MTKQKAGIFGGAGAMGSYFAEIFNSSGFDVLISDVDKEKESRLASSRNYAIAAPERLAEICDIVMWSVPIPETVPMIRRYAPLMKEGSLATDATSVKVEPVKAMAEYAPEGVEIIGMHPMFRPTVSLENQIVVMTPSVHGKGSEWLELLEKIITERKGKVKVTTPEKHDEMMGIIQGLTHTSHFLALNTLRKMNVNLSEVMEFSSPIYRNFFDTIIRILKGSPDLYGSIQMANPVLPDILELFNRSVFEHTRVVYEKDMGKFIDMFNKLKEFLGSYIEEASKQTDKIIGKPLGLELFFEWGSKGSIEDALGRGIAAEAYKERLYTARIPEGELNKLIDAQHKILLAKHTFYKARGASKEGAIAFYISNMKHPDEPDKGIRFSPIVSEDPEKDGKANPHYARIQMSNRFSDPYLNLFDTFKRMEKLRNLGHLVAYRSQKN